MAKSAIIATQEKTMQFATIQSVLIYSSLFLATYFEVFLLITFIGNNKKLRNENASIDDEPTHFPTATIIVPCYNEESTVDGTIKSILALNYPKEKLNITIVDDGSTDNTWKYIQKYSAHPQISIFKKKNGGKYTALNYGIEHSKSDLIGCLDADSYVDKDALRRIARYFENQNVMAVTPAIKIHEPKTIVQHIQYVEYPLGIMVKKLLSYLNSQYVTPGPFTIFRRSVFQKIGPFRHAHNTEDMEMAMRMHVNHLRIENCHKGYVYTVGPRTLKTLYKQRVRWTHGFLENIIDYKKVLFKREHGTLAFITLPFTVVSMFSVLMIVAFILWNIVLKIHQVVSRFMTVGYHFNFHFDPSFIYISTKSTLFISAILLCMTIILLINGKRLTGEKPITKRTLYFIVIYPFIAPFWIARSVFNTAMRKKTSWR